MDRHDPCTSYVSLLRLWSLIHHYAVRWDPNRANLVHFNQSASLYMFYYHLQKLIHRPFITTPQDSKFRFPSLAICTNAARASSHVADIQRRRAGVVPVTAVWPFSHPFLAVLTLWAVTGVWCWDNSPVQHLGRETNRLVFGPLQGDGWRPQVHEGFTKFGFTVCQYFWWLIASILTIAAGGSSLENYGTILFLHTQLRVILIF